MFHVIPFLVGAAAGAVVTYVVKDREAREAIKNRADRIAEGVRVGLGRNGDSASTADAGAARTQDTETAPTAH